MNKIYKCKGQKINSDEWIYGYAWADESDNYFIKVLSDKDYEVKPETISWDTECPYKNGENIFTNDIINGNVDDIRGFFTYIVVKIDGGFVVKPIEWDKTYPSVSYRGNPLSSSRVQEWIRTSCKKIGTKFDTRSK